MPITKMDPIAYEKPQNIFDPGKSLAAGTQARENAAKAALYEQQTAQGQQASTDQEMLKRLYQQNYTPGQPAQPGTPEQLGIDAAPAQEARPARPAYMDNQAFIDASVAANMNPEKAWNFLNGIDSAKLNNHVTQNERHLGSLAQGLAEYQSNVPTYGVEKAKSMFATKIKEYIADPANKDLGDISHHGDITNPSVAAGVLGTGQKEIGALKAYQAIPIEGMRAKSRLDVKKLGQKEKVAQVSKVTNILDKDIAKLADEGLVDATEAKAALSQFVTKAVENGDDPNTILSDARELLSQEQANAESANTTEAERVDKTGNMFGYGKDKPNKVRMFQGFGGQAMSGNDPIVQSGTNAQGQRVGRTKSGKIVPLGK